METTSSRILYICSDIAPYVPDSEMSAVGYDLPHAIQDRGREIRIFMPRFGSINERRNQLHEVIRLSGMNMIIDNADHPLIIKVASMPNSRMQVYFIDNDDYFLNRNVMTDDDGKPYADNDERTIFFARGVMETVKKLRWKPSVIHCQGWFTFLVALFLKKYYKDDPLFARSKVVLVVSEHEGFDAPLNVRMREKMLIEGIRPKDLDDLASPTFENLMRLCVPYADGLIFFGSKKNPTVDALAKKLKKPTVLCRKMTDYADECNEFYTQMMRTR